MGRNEQMRYSNDSFTLFCGHITQQQVKKKACYIRDTKQQKQEACQDTSSKIMAIYEPQKGKRIYAQKKEDPT